MPKDDYSSHSSPEMILFTTDEENHYKSQLDTMQRSTDLGKHRAKRLLIKDWGNMVQEKAEKL